MVGVFILQSLANTTNQGSCCCFRFLRPNFPVTTAGRKKRTRYEPEDNMKIFLLVILEVVEKIFYKIQNIF